MPSDGGGAIHVDRAERVWFAPPEGGLYRLDGERVERVAVAGLEADRVYSIAAAPDGLWLGRQRGGLTRLRFDGASLRARSYTEADGLAQSSVYAVHQARDGSVWAGTLNGGLSRLRDGRITTFTTANGLPSNSVSALVDTQDGTLWAGTPAGLAAWFASAWTTRRVRDGLPSDSVTALVEDSQGVLWIGTSEGLAFLRAGRVESPSAVPAAAARGRPRPGRERGRLALDRDRPPRDAGPARGAAERDGLGDADVVTYGRADGLLGLEGVRRHRSVVADQRGRIWFSTNRGLSVVHPRRATAARAPAIVHAPLAARRRAPDRARHAREGPARPAARPLRVRGREPAGAGARALPLSPRRLRRRLERAGLDARGRLRQPGPGPVPVSRRRRRAPTACGTARKRRSPSRSRRPSGRRTAFRLAAVLAVALGSWLVYAWRLGHVTRRLNAAFEERLAERTRIARELHDTLLQGFVSASMQLHVVAEQLRDASPARAPLGRVQQLDDAGDRGGPQHGARAALGRSATPATSRRRSRGWPRSCPTTRRPSCASSSKARHARSTRRCARSSTGSAARRW